MTFDRTANAIGNNRDAVFGTKFDYQRNLVSAFGQNNAVWGEPDLIWRKFVTALYEGHTHTDLDQATRFLS